MLDKLRQISSLKSFCKELHHTGSLLIEQLWESPKAVLISLLEEVLDKNILILSGKSEGRLLDAFPFFGKEVWDFLPPETPEVSDISGKRLEILYKLATRKKNVLVHASIRSFTHRVLPPTRLLSLCKYLQCSTTIPFQDLLKLLATLGYKQASLVADKGEFAVRGGIVDVFPSSALEPFRIEFYGNTIETIRSFDPISQKSTRQVPELFLAPASEWTLLQNEKTLSTLLDYLGPDTLIVFDDLLEIEDAYVDRSSTSNRFSYPLEDFLSSLPKFPHLFFTQQHAEFLWEDTPFPKAGRDYYSAKKPFHPIPCTFLGHSFTPLRWQHPFQEIYTFFSRSENTALATPEELLQSMQTHPKMELHFLTSGPAEEKTLQDRIMQTLGDIPKKSIFHKGYLPSGFVLTEASFSCVPMPEFTHRYKIRRDGWRKTYHTPPSEFHELHPGDLVVHIHSGIGRFLGITEQRNNLGQEAEFLQIEYAGNSMLYVPVSQSHLVTRYIGSNDEKPTYSVLGSAKWRKTYSDAQVSILGYAKDLLQKTAERTASSGFCFTEDSLQMQLFEEEFPFTETEDQIQAICAIKKDMCSPKVMERLLCGDVGYGKTEVAMRAAFKAVVDGNKQVAVLVPTTILALQHYETFKNRMANFPVEIGILSRFSTAKQTRETLQKAKEGKIDILIGTHKLLGKQVHFADLGLLIIDEEQRFGVRAKEHLKNLKVSIDCLTLSATPIPRTLYLSLVGAREISTINTPPHDRLPIKTMILERDLPIIKNALLHEFSRDGQAIFVHNKVASLPKVYDELQKLLPQARIAMVHGQMDAEEIDAIFCDFKQGHTDLLLSTTIIESGIDIPNVNTIFVDRADTFGMADLYQLRGRVGRWNRPAYAYFLIPKNQALGDISRKRLQSLAESSGYGGGMKLALRDLEIRGAGDILGVQQSGQISAIGFHFYCKLLKKAVDALKNQKPVHFHETKMEFGFVAKLPEHYVNDASLRMEIYYRLGNTTTLEEVAEILSELRDRFGPPPEPVAMLIAMTRIRVSASSLQITSLKFDKMTFHAEKMLGNASAKTTFPLPSRKNIEAFEKEVIRLLQDWLPRCDGKHP